METLISSTATFACGTCVYLSIWHRFPAIESWCLIFPLWFVALAAIRTIFRTALSGLPALWIAVPLVLLVALLSPGSAGPLLGAWIPVCCIAGTISGLRRQPVDRPRRAVRSILIIAMLALISGGAWDFIAYEQMPAEARDRLRPVWDHAQRDAAPREQIPELPEPAMPL